MGCRQQQKEEEERGSMKEGKKTIAIARSTFSGTEKGPSCPSHLGWSLVLVYFFSALFLFGKLQSIDYIGVSRYLSPFSLIDWAWGALDDPWGGEDCVYYGIMYIVVYNL